MNAPILVAAERAAAEVFETIRDAAYQAAREGAARALEELTGFPVKPENILLEEKVTRTEAARRLSVTPQTIIRLEKKGSVSSERTPDGRVYVRFSEVEEALGNGHRRSVAS